jgi:pimeloyl-ACP methyl ester carboxylesterase
MSLDAFVRDLETVVDAMGLDRFPLVGLSQGGAVAITYAARHPERVSKLVLVGASFRMAFPPRFFPDASPQLWSDFAMLMRRTTSGANAARVIEAMYDVDVREQAATIAVPTTVFHAVGDLTISFDQARDLAALIPGSRLVPLDSRNHLLRPDEPAWPHFLDELDRFLDDAV